MGFCQYKIAVALYSKKLHKQIDPTTLGITILGGAQEACLGLQEAAVAEGDQGTVRHGLGRLSSESEINQWHSGDFW